ncbi:haloalkane dehalogenase [Maritimibacter sp. 55A14]|uniref:haloalkane dehalogenase n=1 Tax=Maritimibacter sp. 55A14 TaxID=2174844 RepID=UPI000D614594|nr:haloalkane dehalogenase [Maritimibacter sp. 55A14]PWE33808.1 haloalkane dehalogenase [Maritimibacter sp. 55A14]
MTETPDPQDPHARHRTALGDTFMTHAETGEGPPVVFLHGNPTSSYLWRNVMPAVAAAGYRCLAPDLMGMGDSGPDPQSDYRFLSHAGWLDRWFEAMDMGPSVLVGHDWGGALAMRRARLHPGEVPALALMETIVAPMDWSDFPESAHEIFRGFRSSAGESLVLEKNIFVENVLPASILRDLSDLEMARYRAPYLKPGASRRPTLVWPRELPLAGEPAEVVAEVEANAAFMADWDAPKLFINADPGMILTGRMREMVRGWPNVTEVAVPGLHFIQEDAPEAIGAAVAEFLAGR